MADDDEAGGTPDSTPDADTDTGAGADPEADDAPLADLAREVRARREAREEREPGSLDDPADADAPDTDLFETVDVDAVDDEAIWESFVEGETGPEDRVGLGADVEAAPDPAEHVVPKRDFCQRCPHFSDPPDTACTHAGTTIVEVVDTDHFRVRDCPIVEDENEGAATFD
jgi:hypothetical protein